VAGWADGKKLISQKNVTRWEIDDVVGTCKLAAVHHTPENFGDDKFNWATEVLEMVRGRPSGTECTATSWQGKEVLKRAQFAHRNIAFSFNLLFLYHSSVFFFSFFSLFYTQYICTIYPSYTQYGLQNYVDAKKILAINEKKNF
jgi:hypothetical protein